jgi:osomolarity two-component system sensor histidine kinase SLN1
MVEVRIRYRKLLHASAMPEVSYSNRPNSNDEPHKMHKAANTADPHESSQIGFLFDFEVEDTGPGIPEHLQQEIFKPFVQGDLALSRKHGGTGLGLAICSQLAEMMGGSIVVKSTVDIGSTFTLSIPLRYTKESVPSISGSLARPPSTKAASIASSVQFDTFSSRSRLARDVRSTRSGKASVYSQDRESQLDAPRLVGFSQPYLVDEGLNAEAADKPQELMEKRHYDYKRGNGVPLAPIQSVASPLELMDAPDFGISAAVAESPKETKAARPSPRPLVSPKPNYASVLVAEDNSVNQQVILRLLELEKVSNVTIAENGEEALDKVRNTLSRTAEGGSDSQPFSLIFMDSESSKASIMCIQR